MKIGSAWPSRIFFLLCFLCLTPLIFYPYHYSAYQYPKLFYLTLLLFLLLLFWAFDSLLGEGGQCAWDPLTFSLLVFILWAAIRYPWLSASHANLKAPFLWGNLGLIYLLARQYGAEEGKARFLVQLCGLVALLICLYGLLQFFGIDLSIYKPGRSVFASMRPEGRWGRPFSTLGNPNFLGEYLVAILPLLLVLYLYATSWALKLLGAASTLAALFLLVLSGARGAILAGLVSLPLFVFLERGKGHFRKLLWLALAALVLIATLFSWEGSRSGFYRTWQKVAMAPSLGEGSVGARLLWWRISLEMLKDRPISGVGTGRFREAYPDFQRKFFQDPASASWVPRVVVAWKGNYNATVEAPHNEYLQIAAEMGFTGFILFSAFVLLLLVRAIRGSGTASPSWRNGCIAGCVAVLVASLFGLPLHTPATGFLFFLLAGLLGPPGRPSPDREGGRSAGDALFGTLLVLLAALVLSQLIQHGKVLVSGGYLYRAVGYHLSGRTDRAVTDLWEAKRLNPKDPEIDYWLGIMKLSRRSLDSASSSLERAKPSFNSPLLYLTLAGIHSDLKQANVAEAVYQEGIATYPGLAPLHAGLGALYARSRRYEDALTELKKAQEMDPFYAETYHFLGHVLYRLGRLDAAHQSLERFLQLSPPKDPRQHLDRDLMHKIRPESKSP